MSRNAKTYLIAAIIFLVFLAVVIGLAFLIGLSGSKFTIFVAVLGVVGLIATILGVIYKKKAIDGDAPPTANQVDTANLEALVKSAEARLKQGKAAAKSLGAMPLVYILGDENAGKTQTVLQSGMDAELLAGQVNRDGLVPPTELANIWFTQHSAVVEAGGTLLRQPGLWYRLIQLTAPSKFGAALSKDALQPTRAAVVCVSTERLVTAKAGEMAALGQALNEQLRLLSKALGITLPVYVLFTKLDAIPSFADYVVSLTNDEVRDPLGSLLANPKIDAGLYAETATTQVAQRFDELCYSLAEFRLEVLQRGGQPENLAKAYEFPRELRKLRGQLVDLLVGVGRPSQLGVNPFLRGFYFTGMRARVVEDTNYGPAANVPAAVEDPGATRVFSFSGAQSSAPAQQTKTSRRIPQWVFLPHLFTKVFLADKGALETSRASTRVNTVKRLLIGSVAALILFYLVALTVSYAKNSALEGRLAAASAVPMTSVGRGEPASTSDLENLEKLRAVFVQIDGYKKHGAPLSYSWGIYPGEKLYRAACSAYGSHFRTVLLAPTQNLILAKLTALPVTPKPGDDYTATYRPFRAYLITSPDDAHYSTTDFEPTALQEAWLGNTTTRQIPEASADLALTQFQTYSENLAEPDSCMASLGGASQKDAVEQTRAYLSHFQGSQQVYLSMKAAADHANPSLKFNEIYPGSRAFVLDSYEVEGAFSKGGFTFMQDAIKHPERYASGEVWVLGPQTAPPIPISTLRAEIPGLYLADYLTAWRTYLKSAHVVPAASFAEAKDKLHQLDSPASALLELFQLLTQNTSVGDPQFTGSFGAPHTVATGSAPYMAGLGALEQAINTMLLVPNAEKTPDGVAPVIQAASTAEGSVGTIRAGFSPPDPAGQTDTTSEALLMAPIKSIEALAKGAPAKAAAGGAASFCSQIAPVLAKFPFDPDSQVDASLDEVAKVFQPGTGLFSQFAAQNKMLVLIGTTYSVVPGSPVQVNPAFLNFLNAAMNIGSVLAPASGAPTLNFSMIEEATPNLPPATLDVDGTSLTAAGQAKSFTWKSSPSSTIRITSGNSITATGPWSLLHFAYKAKHPAPNRLEEIFEINGQVSATPTGIPLDYKFDIGGPGAPYLNPGYMRSQLRCVTKVAE